MPSSGPDRRAEDPRLRALADLDNLRKRCAAQVSRAEAEARAAVARQWLPVVDNLDRALEHAAGRSGHASSTASGRSGIRPWRCWPASASRAATTAAPVRPGPARGGRRPGPIPASPTARSSRSSGPATAKETTSCGRRRWWSAKGGLMADGERLLRDPRRAEEREPGRDPAGLPQAGPRPTTRTSTTTRRPRTGSRTSPRPTTSCPTRRPGAGTTPSGATSARFPRTWTRRRGGAARAGAGAGAGRGRWPRPGRRGRRVRRTARLARRRHRHRGPARRDLRRPGGGPGAAGLGPIPGADQEAETRAHRRGGVPGRPQVGHAAGGDGTRAPSTSRSRPA